MKKKEVWAERIGVMAILLLLLLFFVVVSYYAVVTTEKLNSTKAELEQIKPHYHKCLNQQAHWKMYWNSKQHQMYRIEPE